MKLISSLLESSIEQDLNPFIIFNANAKVLKYNVEAEYLLSLVSAKELYDLALNYAPQTYGFKNSYIDIEFSRNHYYALMVGYEDDSNLVLKLYKSVDTTKKDSPKKELLNSTNIYALIEVALNNTLKSSKVIKYLDPSLPEVKLNAKGFLNLLNATLDYFKNAKEVYFSLKIKVAENVVIDGTRYPICVVEIGSKEPINCSVNLDSLTKDTNAVIFVKGSSISIEFPLIL
jgi:nitrogen-specific signal transduction histidine kinase